MFLAVPWCAWGQESLPATYLVRQGDSLSRIAQRFGTTVADLRRGNTLRSDVIHPGDALIISSPFQRQGGSAIRWVNPVRHPGPVLRPFGPYRAGGIQMPRTGTELSLPTGTRLFSPAVGVVRHFGPLDGFGHVLIIEHAGDYASVLSPCDPATLKTPVGRAVLAGEPLVSTAPPPEAGAKPYVHVELRRGEKAIAPDRLLR